MLDNHLPLSPLHNTALLNPNIFTFDNNHECFTTGLLEIDPENAVKKSMLSDSSAPVPPTSQTSPIYQESEKNSASQSLGSSLLLNNIQSNIIPNYILNSLRNASQEALIMTGNNAYIRLLQEQNALKASLEKTCTQSIQSPNQLHTCPDSKNNVKVDPSSSSSFPLPLNITLPPPPHQSDYPEVPFWFASQWKAEEGRVKIDRMPAPNIDLQCNRDQVTSPTLRFITHPNGLSITNSEADEIRRTAKSIWNTLAQVGYAPDRWSNMNNLALQYYQEQMYLKHPITRLCANDWKLRALATKDYPGWSRPQSRQARLPTKLKKSIKHSSSPPSDSPSPKVQKTMKTGTLPANDSSSFPTLDAPQSSSLVTSSLTRSFHPKHSKLSKTPYQIKDKDNLGSSEPVLQLPPNANVTLHAPSPSQMTPDVPSIDLSINTNTSTHTNPTTMTSSPIISPSATPTLPSTNLTLIHPTQPFRQSEVPGTCPEHQYDVDKSLEQQKTNVSSVPSLQDPFASRGCSTRSSTHDTGSSNNSSPISDTLSTATTARVTSTNDPQFTFPPIPEIIPSLRKAFTVNPKTCSEINVFGGEYLRTHPNCTSQPTRPDLVKAFNALPATTKELYKTACKEVMHSILSWWRYSAAASSFPPNPADSAPSIPSFLLPSFTRFNFAKISITLERWNDDWGGMRWSYEDR